MYDNLTLDDIIRVYSEVALDEAIRGVNPGSSFGTVHVRLMMENELKRPFDLNGYGVA